MIIRRSHILGSIMSLTMVLLPFQWIVLFQVGPLAVKPVHLGIFLLLIVVPIFVTPASWRGLFHGHAGLFIQAYLAFWMLSLASVAWSDDFGAGLVPVAKGGLHFIFFLIIAAAVTELGRRGHLASSAAIGIIGGTFGYLLYNLAIFAILGYNFIEEYIAAITNADMVKLKFWFFHNVFNCSFSGSCLSVTDDSEAFGSPLRNTVLGSLVTYFVMSGAISSNRLPRRVRISIYLAAAVCAGLVLTSMSRANMLALVIAGLFAIIFPLFTRRQGLSPWKLAAVSLIAAIATIGAIVLEAPIGFVQSLEERLGESATDPRLVMFGNALDAVSKSPIIGHGAGKELPDGNGILFPVHNVFLASWVEQGFIGLFLAASWYTIILYSMFSLYATPGVWREPFNSRWIALLPIVAMVRVLVSGGGETTLVDWMGLALFFGLVGSRMSRQSPA